LCNPIVISLLYFILLLAVSHVHRQSYKITKQWE
jgi:putative effector of murein hydrolase